MNIVGLDGTVNKINAKNYVVQFNNNRVRSKLHLEVRALIKEIFGSRVVLEEVYIASDRIYFDFLIASANLVIECDGEQHHTFNSHFFNDKLEFKKAQGRDRKKEELCKLNNFTLIRLNEANKDDWKTIIYECFN